ncbi:hypothetical protein CRE_18819 [Caenorhabditis remanei]|uniref:Uncharacterized protein n=1 Tax=Caenorhabditis remanei TaxID=31234 RepID=E3LKN9_CAERE|nr:hypothetical protein CRE_18819 [Caenorhabditis remanei]
MSRGRRNYSDGSYGQPRGGGYESGGRRENFDDEDQPRGQNNINRGGGSHRGYQHSRGEFHHSDGRRGNDISRQMGQMNVGRGGNHGRGGRGGNMYSLQGPPRPRFERSSVGIANRGDLAGSAPRHFVTSHFGTRPFRHQPFRHQPFRHQSFRHQPFRHQSFRHR